MKKIICISAKAEGGKDTVANILKSKLSDCGERVIILHYADVLKFYCQKYFGWDGVKDDYGRSLLQRIGTDIVREKDPDFWVKEVDNFIRIFSDLFDYFIISDCRFPNEIEYFTQKNMPIISVRVERPNHISMLSEEQKNHKSETALDNYFHSHIITNNGTLEQLEDKVSSFIKKFNL